MIEREYQCTKGTNGVEVAGECCFYDAAGVSAECFGSHVTLLGSKVQLIASLGSSRNRDCYRCETIEAEDARDRRHHINDATANERTTIIDPHDGGSPIVVIGHADPGAKRKRAVRRRQAARAGVLSVGGATAGVDRGDTLRYVQTSQR